MFHYIEIPLLIRYEYIDPRLSFWIAGGGYYGFFLGGCYDFNVAGSEWTGSGSLTSGSSPTATEIRPDDYGLLFTLGFSDGPWLFEFRFPVGLRSVLAFTPADDSYGEYREAANSGFIFCAGYSF